MLNRRSLLKLSSATAISALLPATNQAAQKNNSASFRFCLNTSTIMGQNRGLLEYIEIAARSGYDGVELWVNDIKEYLKKGNTIDTLTKFIADKGLKVENAISFTSWMANDPEKRKNGLKQLEEEMKIMSDIGCQYIAAPPMGVERGIAIDFQEAGRYYRDTLQLGRKYGVMPLLEFWGASGTLYNLGQSLAIAAAADDPDARILPDVYHLFRGGSGFHGLKLVSGNAIDVIHFNDYPGNKPAIKQNDSDRVYPGDGIAPLNLVLQYLQAMGGTKVLSLELFNKTYWSQDPLTVAKTGLQKMKTQVSAVL